MARVPYVHIFHFEDGENTLEPVYSRRKGRIAKRLNKALLQLKREHDISSAAKDKADIYHHNVLGPLVVQIFDRYGYAGTTYFAKSTHISVRLINGIAYERQAAMRLREGFLRDKPLSKEAMQNRIDDLRKAFLEDVDNLYWYMAFHFGRDGLNALRNEISVKYDKNIIRRLAKREEFLQVDTQSFAEVACGGDYGGGEQLTGRRNTSAKTMNTKARKQRP